MSDHPDEYLRALEVLAREDDVPEATQARLQKSIQLRPVVPLAGNVKHPPRSWMGGTPTLPPETPWPTVDGRECTFIAQIDCSQLPDDLWLGTGPRTGWLRFFYYEQDPRGWGIKVIHTVEFGERRHSRERWSSNVMKIPSQDDRRAFEPPSWPVDIIPVDEENRESPVSVRREGRFDPTNPLHIPQGSDALGVFIMFIQDKIWGRQDAIRKRAAAASGEAPPKPSPDESLQIAAFANLLQLVRSIQRIDANGPLPGEEWALHKASLDKLGALGLFGSTKPETYAEMKRRIFELAVRVGGVIYNTKDVSEESPGATEAQTQELESLKAARQMIGDVLRAYGDQGDPEQYIALIARLGERNLLPSHKLHEFVTLNARQVSHDYVKFGKLDFPGHERFVEYWKNLAAAEKVSMGGCASLESPSIWTESTDIVLLQLGSSDFFGWQWGDAAHVTVMMPLLDLQAMNFDTVVAEVPY